MLKGILIVAQWIENPTSIHENAGSIPGLTQSVKGSDIDVNCGVGRRHISDLSLLWLWHRLAAAAPIGPLAWELPYAAGAALKRKQKKLQRAKSKAIPSIHLLQDKAGYSAIYEGENIYILPTLSNKLA